ncbi:PepSY-associated TM helix domain-containing protein [Idiomarina xiamenensis]|nr:PepSY-associated TM helix domain-containing protein [Idiomarina xiamenensis]
MTWLHTWAGLVVGWVLFAVFLTGTLAFFQHEITQWMQPELQHRATPEHAVEQAQQFLQERASDAPSWSITLPDERLPVTVLFWRDPNAEGRGFKRAVLDGEGHEVSLRDTNGGYFLYRFHFDLHYMPVFWARWLVGVCSMLMLLAIITGIVIHKKIFKDFFTLQWGKGHRSWLDGHTVTSVLALPFHLMITYTGLVTLMLMYLSSAISWSYGDRASFFNDLQATTAVSTGDNSPAPMTDLQAIYDDAQQFMAGAPVSFISVNNPGQARASATVYEAPTQSLMSSYRTLAYSAVSGERLSAAPIDNTAELTRRTMIGLHAGRFAGTALRWLYFISGVLGTLMVATGLVLWFEKRQKKLAAKQRLPFGHRLVSGLNAGFLMGLPLAVAVYFAANRLLPLTLSSRADWEVHSFFIAWLASVLLPLFVGVKRTWRYGALANAVLYLALPLISLLTLERHLFSYQYPRDWPLLGMDMMLLVSGLLFVLMHRGISRKQSKQEATV